MSGFVLCALVYTVLFDPAQFICWEGKNVPFVSFTAVNLERLTRSEVLLISALQGERMRRRDRTDGLSLPLKRSQVANLLGAG